MNANATFQPITARERIAINLKRLPTERGLSQEGMAESAGFHRPYVSQLERCVTNISIDGLERFAVALGVDVIDPLWLPASQGKDCAIGATEK